MRLGSGSDDYSIKAGGGLLYAVLTPASSPSTSRTAIMSVYKTNGTVRSYTGLQGPGSGLPTDPWWNDDNYGVHLLNGISSKPDSHLFLLHDVSSIEYLIVGGYDANGYLTLSTRNFERTYTLSGTSGDYDWERTYDLTSKYSNTLYTQVTSMVYDSDNNKLYAALIMQADAGA